MWSRLRRWQNNIEANMTQEKYFETCDQMGIEPDPEKVPPELGDFPLEVQHAIMTFGKLGDKIVADIGYLGKDYTAVPLYIDALKVQDKEMFLETLARLDQRIIEKSAAEMKREREKLKSKK